MAVTRWEAFSVTDGWIGIYLPSGNLSHSCSSTRWISNFRWMPHTTVNSTLMVSAGCEEKRVDFIRRKIWKWIPLRVNGEKHSEILLLQRARKPSGTHCLSRNSVRIPHPCTGKKWGRWEDQDASKMLPMKRKCGVMPYVGLQHQSRLWILCYTTSLLSR